MDGGPVTGEGHAGDPVPVDRDPGSAVGTLHSVPTPEAESADLMEETDLDGPVSPERLVAQAVALAATEPDARLVERYWRFAPDEDMVGRTPQDLVDAAARHRELAGQRLPGELKLRVEPPDHAGRTVIEIVVDDMPFLVDSVTGALTSRKFDIYLLVHPMVVVRRTPLGELREVRAELEPDQATTGDQVESWIRIEVNPIRDEREREQLRADLQGVLTDVREAVEDWPKMRAAALAIADELATAQLGGPRPPVPEKDITDSIALLRWLADDHFT